jgi:pimeloyl-ACP methyl ester carboxylesterase
MDCSFGKEPTMTLDTVQYTATAHTSGGWDGASRSADGRLDVKRSSPGTPGHRHHPRNAPFTDGHARCFPRRRMLMSAVSSSPTWRNILVTVAVAGAFGLVLLAAPSDAQTVPSADAQTSVSGLGAAVEDTAVRPFHINVPEEALVDLRRRIAATRWPDRETVTDRSQGVPLATMQALVRYWGTDYDWRKAEAKLNAWPQFMTNIDGLDIHFIHVRSRHPNALPLIMTHGWPGSVFELLKVIGPLTDPPAYGGRAEDAFDLVIPSMPGYGFSGKPQGTDWNPDHIARAWDELMRHLGYTRYVSQGGDWGAVVSDVMARQAPPGLLGIHVNMPATVPPEIAKALQAGDPPPSGLTPEEQAAYEQMNALYTKGSGYALMMVTRPQTLGYSLADSPAGLAAWFYDKFADWTYTGGQPEKVLTRDEMLDDITLYWLTNTGTSGARLYWENHANNFNAVDISLPAAITVFPGEIYQAPRSWAERSYHQLIYYNKVDKGGHFAAWEQPELFASEIRAAFRPLR